MFGAPAQDGPEFVLYHADNIQATGFLEHNPKPLAAIHVLISNPKWNWCAKLAPQTAGAEGKMQEADAMKMRPSASARANTRPGPDPGLSAPVRAGTRIGRGAGSYSLPAH